MVRGLEIAVTEGGVRLDAALLRAVPSSTRAFAKDAMARGSVQLRRAGRVHPARKGEKTRPGDVIVVVELLEEADNLVLPEGDPPPPVFEDASLLAFDKPAGMPVQPLSCRETGTLMNAVANRYPECRAVGDAPLMAGALHRIDAGTSGLVLVARNQRAFDFVRAQFSAQTVVKTYLALVEGSVERGGTLVNDLVHDPSLPCCKMVDAARARFKFPRSFRAATEYRPVSARRSGAETLTLLEVKISTGVTHQIRAQLALAGMHIVNDRLYGAFAVEGMPGHCLHSLSARFVHPDTGEPVEVSTPRPDWAASV